MDGNVGKYLKLAKIGIIGFSCRSALHVYLAVWASHWPHMQSFNILEDLKSHEKTQHGIQQNEKDIGVISYNVDVADSIRAI